MWYFTWILGVGLAVAFGVLNGLWHEMHLSDQGDAGADGVWGPPRALDRDQGAPGHDT